MQGGSNYTIDAKGRVTIPSRFREILGEKFVVTLGFERCLAAYSEARWDRIAGKLNAQPLTNYAARKLSRRFLGNMVEVEVDKMGRILLPQNLRDLIGITKEVVIAGLGDRVEIWDADAWNKENGPDALDDLGEEGMASLAELEL